MQCGGAQLWAAELWGSSGPGSAPAPALGNHFKSSGWCWEARTDLLGALVAQHPCIAPPIGAFTWHLSKQACLAPLNNQHLLPCSLGFGQLPPLFSRQFGSFPGLIHFQPNSLLSSCDSLV